MAKIWPGYEGKEPTSGSPWAAIPVAEAIALFALQPTGVISDVAATPRFGNVDRDLRLFGFKHVVVEIERSEGRQANWKSGFYVSKITPGEAFGRLIRQALVAELGAENVVRVEHEPTTDSQGR